MVTAAVYVSHESTYPSVQQQLSINQANASIAQTEAITQLMDYQSKMLAAWEVKSAEDRKQSAEMLNKIITQRIGLRDDFNDVSTQRTILLREQNVLEINQHKANAKLKNQHNASLIALKEQHSASVIALNEQHSASTLALKEQQLELQRERMQLESDIEDDRRSLLVNNIKMQQDISSRELKLAQQFNDKKLSLIKEKNNYLTLIAHKEKKLEAKRLKVEKDHALDFKNKQKQLEQRATDILTANHESQRPRNVKVVSSNYLDKIKTSRETRTASLDPQLQTSDIKTNLIELLIQLVPDGWEVKSPNDLLNIKTTAVKGTDWQLIVDSLALMHPYLTFTKNFYEKTLIITADKEALELTRSSSKIWHVKVGMTLRDVIDQWTNDSGFDVIWKAGDVNFEIEANGRFVGKFDGKDGVLAQLLKGTQNSKNALIPEFKYGNNVVIIKKKIGQNINE